MAVLGAVVPAGAVPMVLESQQDTAKVSSFTLDFGPGFPLSSAEIAYTTFDLQIDPATGSAQLLNYYQEVDPLLLPDGQGGSVSTGNMTITILSSESGTYSRRTGVFTTQDVYQIEFDGDLSAFGITSPFYLPGSSSGTVGFSSVSAGTTAMAWDGQGELLNGLFPFEYTCSVDSTFDSTNATAFVATAEPAFDAIDAGIPFEPNDTAVEYGWDGNRVTFNAPPAGVAASDFLAEVDELPADVQVVDASGVDAKTFELDLNGPVAPGAWTVLTHVPSGTTACLGFLPGDVDGTGTANASDVATLIEALSGVGGGERPLFATDIDRSGSAGPADITMLIDLLNGAGAFDPWNGVSIGASPCQG